MSELTRMKCTPCRGGEPTLTDKEILELLPQVPEWEVVERDGVKRLERVFKFTNFLESLIFTYRVGQLAEEEGHHPVLTTEWGRVKVSWWTHKIKGLHRNDFIMAAKTDRLYIRFKAEENIDAERVLRVIMSKREIRKYVDREVPEEVIYKILEAGRLAGSAKNRQPWHFILIREKQNLEGLARFGDFASHLQEAAFAVVILIPDTYVQDRFDAGRAAQNMMLAASALGVGSCPITLHRQEEAKKFLNVPPELNICVCIAFGYSAGEKPRGKVIRKPLNEILHYERYGEKIKPF